jgi:predicted MPP superfamily phosphohydrolase
MDTLRMALFATVASLILFFGTFYVGLRLATLVPLKWRWLFWLITGVCFALMPAAFMLMRVTTVAVWHRPLYLAGFLVMGIMSLLFAGYLVLDVARGLLVLFSRVVALVTETSPVAWLLPDSPDRRDFLLRCARGTVAVGALCIAGWGFVNSRRKVAVVRVEVVVADLPTALEGFRIAQITDLHVCPDIRRPYVQDVVDLVNGLDPHLVAFTGDLADGQVEVLRDDCEPLRELNARHGTWFVNGNHEFYSDIPGWAARIDELGMTNLVNQHVVLEHDDARLVLAGINDPQAARMPGVEGPDLEKALAGAPQDLPRILLTHNPMTVTKALSKGLDLIICGHTHGGQYAPWTSVVGAVMPYPCGLYKEGRTTIYTSRGTGYWGPPMRTNGPGEVTLITLRRGDAARGLSG